MTTLTILGSCVTRDAFEMTSANHEIKHYFARTSLISLTSPPLNMTEDEILLDSKFQRRCVYNDLSKRFFNEVKEQKTDFIIIDLIDERFNLLKTNDSFITKSNEFSYAKFNNEIHSELFKRDDKLFPTWQQASDKFFEKVFEVYSPSQIILHKTYWKEKFLNSEGEKQSFGQKLNEINHHNRLLNLYYEHIEKTQPGIKMIDMTKEDFSASEKHKWGLSPFHFEKGYYHYFLERLTELTT